MANDDLPPSLRGSDDLPPSLRGTDDLPPSLRTQSTIQKVAQASGLPMRGLRGVGVGVEKLFTGNEQGLVPRVGEAAQAASEATQPDFQAKPGEKIGATAGEFADPRFMAFGAIGEAAASARALKVAFAGAAALGGVQATEDLAKTGQVDPKAAGIAAAEGAGGGLLLHGATQAVVKGAEMAGSKGADIVGKMIDRALGPEVEPGFSDLTKPVPPSPQKNFLLGKQAGPPAPVINPKNFPQAQPLVKASAPTGSKETSEFLEKMKRKSEGMSTSLDLVMDWVTGQENAPKAFASQDLQPPPNTTPSLQGPAGTETGISGPLNTVFANPQNPLLQHITGNPDFVNLQAKTRGIVDKYSKSMGVPPSNQFMDSLFKDMHDELGRIRTAKPADRAAIAKEVSAKYPDINEAFGVLKHSTAFNRLINPANGASELTDQMSQFYFDQNIKGSYAKADPQAMINTVMDGTDRGKTVPEIAQESGIDKKVVQTVKNLTPPIDTTELKIHDAAARGDPQAQLNVLQKAMRYWIGSPTEASSTAKNLYRRRYGDIGVGYFDSRLFIRDSVGHLNDIERQALPFIIEGKLPEANKFVHPQAQEILDTAQRFLQNPNDPAMRNLAMAQEKIGKYFDEGHEFLSKNFDELGYKDNYVNHLWERNPQTSEYGPSGASLSQKNPFAKKRYIASYADGINQGLTPKTLDMAELLKTYDNYKIKTVANMRFREGIGAIRVEGGRPAVLPTSEAPPDWKYVDSNFFTGLKVHPEVYDAVRAIVDKPFAFSEPGPNAPFSQKAFHSITNAYDYLNAYTKKFRLSISLFHHFSLTETALGGGTNPLKVLKDQALNIWKGAEYDGLRDLPSALYKSFKEGHAAFANLPLSRDAVEHGLQIGSISDAQRGTVVKGLMKAEEFLKPISPLASKAFQGVRTFNDIWDKELWDYYHAGIKLQMYENHVAENIKAFGDKMPAEQIKRETADFINKATGGALETLMYSPKYRQALHWAMLAPDWTLTRLQTAGSVFKAGPQGFQGRKFWLRAGVAYFSSANLLNYVNTQKALGQGRFIWQNDPGKQWHVFLKKDDQGRNVYIMPAKTLVEVVGWFNHPLETLGAKAAPVIQMVAEALQKGNRTLTGFNIPEDQQGVGQFLKRNITPFSMQKSNLAFTFPLSRGISKTEVINLIQKGIEQNDEKALQTALKFGVENGYDVGSLKNIAIKNVRSKVKKEALATE